MPMTVPDVAPVFLAMPDSKYILVVINGEKRVKRTQQIRFMETHFAIGR